MNRQERQGEDVGAALDVIGFGAMNLDEIAVVSRIVLDGETRIRELRRRPGGSAANTVNALAKLGMATGYVGAVGDDTAGRTLVEDLTKAGVNMRQVVLKGGEPTGFVWAIADAANRSLYVYPGANDLLGRQDVHLSSFAQARLVHLSSFVNPRQLALQVWAVRQLPLSVKISFAPGSLYAERGVAALRPILKRTTVLFLNGDEARLLTRRKDVRSAAEVLHGLGCRTVAISLGAGQQVPSAGYPRQGVGDRAPRGKKQTVRAACYVTDGRVEEVVPPIVWGRRAVDSVGAGDAFAAGFLYGILKGSPLRECAHLGQLVASCSLRAPGAREGLPTLREVREAYRRHFGSPPI